MNFSTADFSVNDRKKLMISHFENFEGTHSDFTLPELYDFLDKKMGKPFDRNIGFQIAEIVKGEHEKMNLSEFIAQYLDTEDTLNFRIDLDKKRIEELISKKEELFREKINLRQNYEENGDFLKLYSVLRLFVKEASNLEGKSFNGEVNSYVKILSGERVFHTARINEEKNPEFNQEFEMVLKDDVEEIKLIVCDSQKPGEENVLGFARLTLNEINQKLNEEKSEYLMRDDGLRTRSKLVFSYKLEPSKLKEIDENSQKLDIEINEIEQIMKENQKVLFLLREPFSTTFQPLPSNKMPKNNQKHMIYEEGMHRNNTEDLETNDDNDDGGKLSEFEEKVKVKIEVLARKFGVTDWQKIMVISTAIFIALALFISFLRSTFYDVMVIGVILIKSRMEFDKLNFFFMRVIVIMMSFSLVIDLIWLIFYTDNWTEDSYETDMDSLKTFVIVMSFFQFFYKFFYGLILWRYSVNVGELRNTLKNLSFS